MVRNRKKSQTYQLMITSVNKVFDCDSSSQVLMLKTLVVREYKTVVFVCLADFMIMMIRVLEFFISGLEEKVILDKKTARKFFKCEFRDRK